jgi:endonuclease G, mitochondrial
MASFDEGQRKQSGDAASRVQERAPERRKKKGLLSEKGGIARADEPARVATRIDRLSRYHPDVRPIDPAKIAREDPSAMAAAGAVLERIIQTEDFLGVGYLEAGVVAARSVGRVNIREGNRLAGYGSGSMVSPRLFLTNHHVLSDVATAEASTVEFDYQDGPDGLPLKPTLFSLDPETFFVADEELDFALVAVEAYPNELAPFGFNRLIEAEGKAIVGDFVTIVQHPQGEKKQVALRENRIVDLLELFVHYETDTEPGSSGSPVFNDQWEVVALHHAAVPAQGEADTGGYVNEGIRVSRLIRFIRGRDLSDAQKGMVEELFTESAAVAPMPPAATPGRVTAAGAEQVLTVPIEIRLGTGGTAERASAAAVPEAITIDPDYAARPGYDPEFLGTGPAAVPLPTLSEKMAEQAGINSQATSDPRYVLPYHHFSVIMNRDRRLAFLTAVNIDGATAFRLPRESDRWFLDPRLPEEEQTGEDAYTDNPLDRGHLVRRLDPAWGSTTEAAKAANDDTYHFTNCTPQHEDFNQNQSTWAGLEDYILENADNRDFRASVFTGPVFAQDDEEFQGVQLPRQYWKVAVMVKEGGDLSATGYLLSQEELIRGLELAAPEEFSYGAYETFQVPVRRIEELTGLSFGTLADADPLGQLEAAMAAKVITRPEDIVL